MILITDTVRADIDYDLINGKSKTATIKHIQQKYAPFKGYVDRDFVVATKLIRKEVERQIEKRGVASSKSSVKGGRS